MVSDESHPGIKELTATNASSVYFSAVVTAVPKFMKSNNEYQKFLSGGVKLIPEMFDDSERPENGDVIEIDDIKKSHENSIFDGNTSPLIQTMIRKDSKFTSAINKGQLESNSRTDGSGYVRNQNEAFTYSPNIAYIKKFEKFFDFLQKTIKKISKAVKEESNEKQEDLKSPLKGINIIKHSGQIRNNTLNTEASETERIASVSENSTSIPTTTGKLKIQGNLDNDIYGRIRNEENMIVHTPIDSSEYNTAVAKKFRGLFGTPFLQLDEKEIVGKVEMINYQKEHEHSFDERNFHGAIEKNEKKSEIMEENGCVLEGQADSSASDDSSEYATRPVKQYKCNIEAQTTTETTIEPFPKTPEKFKKAQLPSESNEEHKNQKKGRRKLEDKLLNKIDNTLEYETTPPLLQDVENEDSLLRKKNKSSTINHKLHSEYNNDETIKIISEEEDDEESDESSDQQSTKHIINPNELSEQKSVNKHAKSTVQPLDSPLTDKHIKIIDSGSDSMGFEKISAKTKGGKLPLQKAVYLDGDKLVNEFEFPVHKQSKQYKVLESNSTFPMEENVTNKYDLELYSRSQMTDPHLSNSQSLPLEQTQLQAIDIKYQTVSNSSEEDEFPDKVLNDMLTTTFSEIDQASTISKVTKFKNHRKKNSQKTTKPLMKLRKNDTVSQIPKISMTLPALPTISPSATTSLTFSSAMDHPTDENINQTSTMSNMVSNAVTHLEDNNDTYDLSVENTEIGKALSDFIPDMERSGRNKVRGEQQHNEEIGLVQKERKECLDGKKCPTEKVSMEEVIPTTNTT